MVGNARSFLAKSCYADHAAALKQRRVQRKLPVRQLQLFETASGTVRQVKSTTTYAALPCSPTELSTEHQPDAT